MIRLIDIEKELRSIKTEYKPDEGLRQRTRSLVTSKIGRKKAGGVSLRKAAFVYSPITAAVLVLALCVSLLTAAPAKAAGYYTIDINPSISVAVDQNNTVISVSPDDDDAVKLLEGLDIKGMQFEDALKAIVQAAAQRDFLKENGHVLVAYFGEGEGISRESVNSIVSGQISSEKISTLAISGSEDDYNNAKKSGRKAGIELLLNNADAAGIEEKDPDTVISIMGDKLDDEKDNPGKDKNKDKEKDNNNNKDKEKDNNNNKNKDKDKDNNRDKDNSKDKDNKDKDD